MSFEVATNSPLESRLSILIQRLIESGYMKHGEEMACDLIRDYTVFTALHSNTTAGEGKDAVALTSYMTDKIFIYGIIFSVGYVVAFVIFFAEIIHFRYWKNTPEKKRFLNAKKRAQNVRIVDDIKMVSPSQYLSME